MPACCFFLESAIIAGQPQAIKCAATAMQSSLSPDTVRLYDDMLERVCTPAASSSVLRALQVVAPMGIRPSPKVVRIIAQCAAAQWFSSRQSLPRCPHCVDESGAARRSTCPAHSTGGNVGDWIVQPSRVAETLDSLSLKVRGVAATAGDGVALGRVAQHVWLPC